MSQFFKKKAPDSVDLRQLDDVDHDEMKSAEELMQDKNVLSFYRTNDVYWYKAPELHTVGLNYKLLCFMASFFGALIIIVAVTISTIQARKDAVVYNHDKVRVIPFGKTLTPTCRFLRNCTAACSIELEHEIGCCIGCGLTTDCNFDVSVAYQQVESLPARQRIWLFASTNGKGFFQTGFAPWITGSSGTALIQNGCFSAPSQQVILVACLSTNDLQNKAYDGFPADSCSSTYGVCVASNSIFNQPLDSCSNDLWEGNKYTTSWDGPKFSGDVLLQPSFFLIAISIGTFLITSL